MSATVGYTISRVISMFNQVFVQLTEWSLRGIWLSNGPFLILGKLKGGKI